MIKFIVGLVLGCFVGIGLMCLLQVSKNENDIINNANEKIKI